MENSGSDTRQRVSFTCLAPSAGTCWEADPGTPPGGAAAVPQGRQGPTIEISMERGHGRTLESINYHLQVVDSGKKAEKNGVKAERSGRTANYIHRSS